MQFINLIKNLFLINFYHFLFVYLFSLIIIFLYFNKFDKLSILFTIILFNLNSLIHTRLFGNSNDCDQNDNQLNNNDNQLNDEINYDWLQSIINQLWSSELVKLFQKQLNKYYTKERNTEFKFYHFFLNENDPPKLDQIYLPLDSIRNDEIVINLRLTIKGTVLLKLNEDREKDETEFINLLINKYDFKRKFQSNYYQETNLKKKIFLTKEFNLNGRSRLILRPLINIVPYFTSIYFTLLDYPILYSNDIESDLFETTADEFETKFYNYLIERICLPFIYPNKLIILYSHKDYIQYEHNHLFKEKLKTDTNQYMQSKLRRKLMGRKKLTFSKFDDLINELNDKKIINWYRLNVIKNLQLIELNLNLNTFHPNPLFLIRIKLIELDNLGINSPIFIRIRIGEFSIAKIRLINQNSPIINLIALLPVHDYYEYCTIQFIQIDSFNAKQIKKSANDLNSLIWNQKLIKLPQKDEFIRPIGELTIRLDKKIFDFNSSDNENQLNGQDIWLPLATSFKSQCMVHLSLTSLKFCSLSKTIRKSSKITKNLMLTKNDLIDQQLPISFIKIYVENFQCTYNQDNKLKSNLNQLNRIQFNLNCNNNIHNQKKSIDLMKITKSKLIFRNSCYFFTFDDPFKFDLIIELIDKNKVNDQKIDQNEDKLRLINLIRLNDYKKNKIDLIFSETIKIYILNNKDFKSYLNDKNLKLDDRDEYGILSLNLFIRYVQLDNFILERILMVSNLRGDYNLDDKKLNKQKITKQDKLELLSNKKQKDYHNDECLGSLYFKLLSGNLLEICVLSLENVPYDKTKRIKIQVIIELWKGNYKVLTKKTSFTDIVHNPIFDQKFKFNLDSGNLQQYAIRFIIIQKTGYFRANLKIIADRFCTLPLLTLDSNFIIRSYNLKIAK